MTPLPALVTFDFSVGVADVTYRNALRNGTWSAARRGA
jgi:hypothetical protein